VLHPTKQPSIPKGQRPPTQASAAWKLEDAKARFSEVVRRARTEGPQHVTVRGQEAVVVIAVEELRTRPGTSALIWSAFWRICWGFGHRYRAVISGRILRRLLPAVALDPPLVAFLQSLDLSSLDLDRERDLGRDVAL